MNRPHAAIGLAVAATLMAFLPPAAANPLAGYAGFNSFYTLPYANAPGFGANQAPADPQVRLSFSGNTLAINLDTGSRALYVATSAVTGIAPETALMTGQVYLNSSARIFQGTWYQQTVEFPEAVPSDPALGPAAAAMPVLIVDTLACSPTPPPGSSTASTTFRTLVESGTAVLTDGTSRPFTASTLTLFGGEAVSYLTNPGILAPVANFGVGFDRTGNGTSPNNDAFNQQYNAFFNLPQMQAGAMLPGYIVGQTAVQLGLTATTSGFAYTDLVPTGYARPAADIVPDWQAPTGTLGYGGQEYGTGQIVVDIGINSGILTLPGQPQSGAATFSAESPLVVNLLNSAGAVRYTINGAAGNYLDPTSVSWFAPLPGNFSENRPPFQDQFFNTGRNVINAFDFLYDGLNGYAGLRPNGLAIPSADIQFTAGFYANPVPEPGVARAALAAMLGLWFAWRRCRIGARSATAAA
jgi:hypothetical protein